MAGRWGSALLQQLHSMVPACLKLAAHAGPRVAIVAFSRVSAVQMMSSPLTTDQAVICCFVSVTCRDLRQCKYIHYHPSFKRLLRLLDMERCLQGFGCASDRHHHAWLHHVHPQGGLSQDWRWQGTLQHCGASQQLLLASMPVTSLTIPCTQCVRSDAGCRAGQPGDHI